MRATQESKQLALLRARNHGGTSDYALVGLSDALERHLSSVDNDSVPLRFLGKVLKTWRLQGSVWHRADTAYFLGLMGPQTFRAFPQGLIAELIVYAYDCWPSAYDEWERFFRVYRISTAFFSARMSAERMGKRIGGLDAIWMPEAIDPRSYRNDALLRARRTDLLELGRRSDIFHDRITGHCERRGYVHLYQRSATSLVFPTRQQFLEGIAQSKILACFPSSMTHPERSGDVETLTLRYLEGIASGCLLLGRCPDELKILFGYDPVVAADLDNPGSQLDAILVSIESFEPLIARNSRRLNEVGTWDVRVATMLAILEGKGYRIPATSS